MVSGVVLMLTWLRSLFLSRSQLQAEVLLLRHQLNVLQRAAPRRRHLNNGDRLFFVWLFRLSPTAMRSLVILRPETIVRWHRQGWRSYWRWRSRARPGRPPVPGDIRALNRQICTANPLWGAPRIHGELLKLWIAVSQSTVSRYMDRRRRPPGQRWTTFLRNHADGIAAIDLFVVPTVTFKLLYRFIVLRHGRRHLLWIGATSHPTAEWLVRQITEAFPWETVPRHVFRDRDRSYGAPFRRRLGAMGIRDRPIAPRSPWQNAHAERLIGSIRRECLDHLIVLNEVHLRRVLDRYATYYNRSRTHLSLAKDAPLVRSPQTTGTIIRVPHLGGLHHVFARIE